MLPAANAAWMRACAGRLQATSMAARRAPALQQAFFATSGGSEPSVVEKAREAVGKVTEKVGEMFQESGSVGKQFTPEGAAGGTAQEVGGPFDKEGAVGKQFTTEGSIGGNVQAAAEAADEKGEQMQRKAQEHQGQEAMKESTPGMSRDRP